MPKVVDHEERRAGFVTASWDVIAEEGLGAATLRRVASAAGVTTGALTHYFFDREALPFDAARLREWRVWLAFWGEAVGNPRLRRENEERVAEWRDLLEALVAPLVAGAATSGAASAELLSLVDGLGLRLALAPRATLAREQAAARSVIDRAVMRLSRLEAVPGRADEPESSEHIAGDAK
jgi:AcrR family transcriptional regulator